MIDSANDLEVDIAYIPNERIGIIADWFNTVRNQLGVAALEAMGRC